MNIWLVILTLTLGFTIPASAAEDLVKVTAVTQYVEGRVQKTESSGVKSDLVFQTPIYEGDRVDTGAGMVLKLATRNGCIYVMRGVGTLAAPVAPKPWRLRAESLRLICSGRTTAETFGVANHPLSLKDGEVLFRGKQVMLLNGAASYMGVALSPRKLYIVEGAELRELLPQPNSNDLRAFNLAEKPPRESFSWPYVEPAKAEKAYTSRYMIGPVGGGDGVNYDNSDYSQGGLRGGGGRLQAQFKRSNDTAFIFALTTRETSKDDGNYQGPPGPGPHNQIEFHSFEFGLRQKFDRWWSPFVRLGGGFTNAKVGYTAPGNTGGNDTRYGYEFYFLNATLGIDTYFVPRFLRPFGFYASGEGAIYQSLHRGARRNENGGFSPNAVPPEAWRLTGFDVLVSAGLVLEF
jgi:hypothetical protein